MTLTDSSPLLEVKNLVTQFSTETGPVRVVDDVSFHINEGETLGLVGESGCGKSITALSVMQLIPAAGQIAGGEVLYGGQDLLQLPIEDLRAIRGREIAMIFQEPMSSLNPVLSISRQLSEPLRLHMNMTKKAAWVRSGELLEMVGIPDPGDRLDDYPHRLSGGQRQRVMIAMALSCNPKLLIADEATTALDVTIQAQILELMVKLTHEIGTALMIITHNLGVVARFANRVNVMYSGRIRETGSVDAIFDNPHHPYTVGLLDSIPRFDEAEREKMRTIEGEIPDPANRPSGCTFRTRCRWATDECTTLDPQLVPLEEAHNVACWRSDSVFREPIATAELTGRSTLASNGAPAPTEPELEPLIDARDVKVHFPITSGIVWTRTVGHVKAVDGVSLSIMPGETLGLVGESGSGKTTFGRALLRLIDLTSGDIDFDGDEISLLKGKEMRRLRRHLGMVFQDPYGSLNQRMTVGATIGEPLIIHKLFDGKADYNNQIGDLLETVGLQRNMADRYPHEFSGGQRQRIGVARTLAAKPKFIVLDEPVSALDVSIQAQLINLLEELQAELDLTYLFIAHDLSVVRHISHRVAVMYLGKLVELASYHDLYAAPQHPYTQALLSAIPLPDPSLERKRERIVLGGDVPSPRNPPPGCVFHTRCPIATEECSQVMPELKMVASNHQAACIKI